MGRHKKPKPTTGPGGLQWREKEDGTQECRYNTKITVAGKRYNVRTSWYDTKEQAEQQKHKIIARLKAGVKEDRSQKKTLMDLVREYNEFIMSDDNTEESPGSNKTLRDVGSVMEQTLPKRLAQVPYDDIDKGTVYDWAQYYCYTYRSERTGKRISPATFAKYKRYMKRLLHWTAMTTSWVRDNPLLLMECDSVIDKTKRIGESRVRKEKAETIQEDEYYSLEQFMQLLNSVPYEPVQYEPLIGPEAQYAREDMPRLTAVSCLDWKEGLQDINIFAHKGKIRREVIIYTVFVLLYFTGMRSEELRALTWDAINYKKNSIDIRTAKNYRAVGSEAVLKAYREKAGTTKNKSSNRKVFMLIPVRNALKTYQYIYKYVYGSAEGKQLLFIPEKGSKDGMLAQTSMQNWIDQYGAAAGIPHGSPHKFRHSCAMYLAVNLRFPKELSAIFFGHADTDMLDRVYTHKDKDQNLDLLEAAFMERGVASQDWPEMEQRNRLLAEFWQYARDRGVLEKLKIKEDE